MKPSEKLYYQSNRKLNFESKIINQKKTKKGWWLVLEKTLFYPEGGGQPSDKGVLNGIEVLDVIKKEDIVYHLLPTEIQTEFVKGEIDWAHRFDYMQQHTGQHLISAALWHIGKFKTVSVNMSSEYTTVEIEAKHISDEDLNKVEDLVNLNIRKNLKISDIFTEHSELSKYNLRRPCLKEGKVRLIKIEGADCVACGGIHLDYTGEVGLVKCIRIEKIRGNVRIYWKIGSRAYLDYHHKAKILSKLKVKLNSNENGLEEKVDLLKKEISDIKIRKTLLEKKTITFYKDELLKDMQLNRSNSIITKYWQNEENTFILKLVKILINHPMVIICFINKTDDVFKWTIACGESVEIDFNFIKKQVLNKFGCKGGGRFPIWQGVGDFENQEKSFLETFENIFK